MKLVLYLMHLNNVYMNQQYLERQEKKCGRPLKMHPQFGWFKSSDDGRTSMEFPLYMSINAASDVPSVQTPEAGCTYFMTSLLGMPTFHLKWFKATVAVLF